MRRELPNLQNIQKHRLKDLFQDQEEQEESGCIYTMRLSREEKQAREDSAGLGSILDL